MTRFAQRGFGAPFSPVSIHTFGLIAAIAVTTETGMSWSTRNETPPKTLTPQWSISMRLILDKALKWSARALGDAHQDLTTSWAVRKYTDPAKVALNWSVRALQTNLSVVRDLIKWSVRKYTPPQDTEPHWSVRKETPHADTEPHWSVRKAIDTHADTALKWTVNALLTPGRAIGWSVRKASAPQDTALKWTVNALLTPGRAIGWSVRQLLTDTDLPIKWAVGDIIRAFRDFGWSVRKESSHEDIALKWATRQEGDDKATLAPNWSVRAFHSTQNLVRDLIKWSVRKETLPQDITLRWSNRRLRAGRGGRFSHFIIWRVRGYTPPKTLTPQWSVRKLITDKFQLISWRYSSGFSRFITLGWSVHKETPHADTEPHWSVRKASAPQDTEPHWSVRKAIDTHADTALKWTVNALLTPGRAIGWSVRQLLTDTDLPIKWSVRKYTTDPAKVALNWSTRAFHSTLPIVRDLIKWSVRKETAPQDTEPHWSVRKETPHADTEPHWSVRKLVDPMRKLTASWSVNKFIDHYIPIIWTAINDNFILKSISVRWVIRAYTLPVERTLQWSTRRRRQGKGKAHREQMTWSVRRTYGTRVRDSHSVSWSTIRKILDPTIIGWATRKETPHADTEPHWSVRKYTTDPAKVALNWSTRAFHSTLPIVRDLIKWSVRKEAAHQDTEPHWSVRKYTPPKTLTPQWSTHMRVLLDKALKWSTRKILFGIDQHVRLQWSVVFNQVRELPINWKINKLVDDRFIIPKWSARAFHSTLPIVRDLIKWSVRKETLPQDATLKWSVRQLLTGRGRLFHNKITWSVRQLIIDEDGFVIGWTPLTQIRFSIVLGWKTINSYTRRLRIRWTVDHEPKVKALHRWAKFITKRGNADNSKIARGHRDSMDRHERGHREL